MIATAALRTRPRNRKRMTEARSRACQTPSRRLLTDTSVKVAVSSPMVKRAPG